MVSKVGVIHGRFQLLHNDHLKYLLAGKMRCEHLVVGITNPDPIYTAEDEADKARSLEANNPFTYFERYQMVRLALQGAGCHPDDFSIVPFPINSTGLYRFYVPMDAVFYLTIYDKWGERKLEMFQGLGLQVEILWRKERAQKGISGCDVRRLMAEGKDWEYLIPEPVAAFIKKHGLIKRLVKTP